MKTIKKNQNLDQNIVTQANNLIEAKYSLTFTEQKLILIMLSMIQPNDENFKAYEISIVDLSKFLGVDKNHMYVDCKKITHKLLKKVIEIQEPDGLLQTHWLSSAKYVEGAGVVKLSFDPELKPYLLKLQSNFTSCKLKMLLSFKSHYTMRIYSLLQQYKKLKTRSFKLEILRSMLGIEADQYNQYSDFKKKVLIPVQLELKLIADIYYEFEEIKSGRAVNEIKFNIFIKKHLCKEKKPKSTVINKEENENINQLLGLIPLPHRNKATVFVAVNNYLKDKGFDYVKRNILYCNLKTSKSYAGFLNTCLKEDWGHDWDIDQKTPTPVKPKAIEIWERAGFKSQKDYDDFMYEEQMKKYKK